MSTETIFWSVVGFIVVLVLASLGGVSSKPAVNFYRSRAWLDLRYRVIRTYGRTCMACGATRGQMHVDHIKPRSTHPRLALEFDNMQVLCASCNRGKSNKWADDFRERNRRPS